MLKYNEKKKLEKLEKLEKCTQVKEKIYLSISQFLSIYVGYHRQENRLYLL